METEGETEEQNKKVCHSVHTNFVVRDHLIHVCSHKSGPMPKVKEALLLVYSREVVLPLCSVYDACIS